MSDQLFSSNTPKKPFSFLSSDLPQKKELTQASSSPEDSCWKVLVVDDEEDIHTVTKLALKGFMFEDRHIEFLHAYSAQEARAVLEQHNDIALALVDVVMETPKAGLHLVEYIRTEQQNNFTRIILRTGQPGEAPEREVIQNYAIDDYELKTDLTRDKLFSVILASLRTYEAMVEVESYRLHLDRKVKDRTREIEIKNEQLNSQKQQLEELNQLKNKLFSIIAHDLRSPFANIKILLDMLQDGYLEPEELTELLPSFQSNLDSTFDLLENLLSWASSQLKGSTLKREMTSLKGLIHGNKELFTSPAQNKGILLTVQAPEDIELNVDPSMIKLVIRNLLSNALKFTPQGGQITLTLSQEEQVARIDIQDSGEGISPENQEKLFQLKSFSTRGTAGEQGTGLGLALCKEFVEKHQGHIEVQSTPGQGSTFSVFLPLALRA